MCTKFDSIKVSTQMSVDRFVDLMCDSFTEINYGLAGLFLSVLSFFGLGDSVSLSSWWWVDFRSPRQVVRCKITLGSLPDP